jgi:hypothetical protein
VPDASSVELVLHQGQSIDLGLSCVKKCGRPLEARLPVFGGVGIDEHRDGQQVALLLVLIPDHLAGLGLLGVQSSLSGGDGGDRRGKVGPGVLQLRRHLDVFRLGRG